MPQNVILPLPALLTDAIPQFSIFGQKTSKILQCTMYNVAAMDQKLHFWPPGGHFLYFLCEILEEHALFMFEQSL